MSGMKKGSVKDICATFDNDRSRLLDIVLAVQEEVGHVSGEAMTEIAERLEMPRVEVEGVVSFYSFLSSEPGGRPAGGGPPEAVVIRLCDDVIVNFHSTVTRSITESGTYSSTVPADEAARWRKNAARFDCWYSTLRKAGWVGLASELQEN